MYGSSVGQLAVYVKSRGEGDSVWRMFGDQGKRWINADIRTQVIQSDVVCIYNSYVFSHQMHVIIIIIFI